MKVVLAETLGFCGGVKKAVDLMYSTVSEFGGKSVLMEGPIIHNRLVIEDLGEKGSHLLSDSDDIVGKKVVVRAHGITPEVEKSIISRGGEIVDGTCPIVISSQIKIKKYVDDGFFIVLAGDKGHAEVIGLVGQAPDDIFVVARKEDLDGMSFPKKTLYMSQTTFSKPEFYEIESELKKICPTLKTLCTICGATKQRQDAVVRLAQEVEAVIVVGGLTSSNTKRLKIAAEKFVPTWLIECESDIPDDIKKFGIVGVTAGASTPDNVINAVVEKLKIL